MTLVPHDPHVLYAWFPWLHVNFWFEIRVISGRILWFFRVFWEVYVRFSAKMLVLVSVMGTSWPLEAVGFFPCIVNLVTDASRDYFRVYYIAGCRYFVRFNWNYIVFLCNISAVTLPLGTSWPVVAVGFFPCILIMVTDESRDNLDVYYTECGLYFVRFN